MAEDGPIVGDGESGRDIFINTLVNMGFTRAQADSLGATLWTASKTKNEDALYNDLIGSAEYAERFPGMKALRDKGKAISESQYITFERSYEGAARSAGLPVGFYDKPDDFGKLIANGVSPAEYAGRINQAQTLALGVDPTFREEFARQLPGANLGDLTAFLLDPDKGTEMINQKYVRAQIGTSARRNNFGMLTQSEIDDLQARGGDDKSAEAGFGQLAGLEGLTTNTAGETMTDQNFTREEKLGFVANDPKAAMELEQRKARRQAGFSGGGGAASGGEGKQGLG